MGDNSDKKKKLQITYFFMRNPYMKFQNISIHGSKVMLGTRKRDEQTNERTSQKQYAAHFFRSWGHKYGNSYGVQIFWVTKRKLSIRNDRGIAFATRLHVRPGHFVGRQESKASSGEQGRLIRLRG